MNTQPLVSILIPASKVIWLDQAIMSIQTQTFKNYEIIIGDDTQNDSVIRKITQWQNCGIAIQYYKNTQPDRTGFNNYAMLLSKANGRYTKFLQDDELLLPSSLEILLQLMENHKNCTFSFHHRFFMNESGLLLHSPVFLSGKGSLELSREKFFKFCIAENLDDMIGQASNVLYTTETLRYFFKQLDSEPCFTKYYWSPAIHALMLANNLRCIGHTDFASCFRLSELGNSHPQSFVLFYKNFQSDFLRRWCAQKGFLSHKEYQFMLKHQISKYQKKVALHPLFETFITECQTPILNNNYLTPSFLQAMSAVEKIMPQ